MKLLNFKSKNAVAKADTGRNTDPPVRTTVTGKPGETAMASAAASIPTTPLLAGASVASINNVQDPAQAASISSSIAANSITSVNNAELLPAKPPSIDGAESTTEFQPPPTLRGNPTAGFDGLDLSPTPAPTPTQGIVNDDQGGPR